MKAQPRSAFELMKALAGPIIWAAHFFVLYLVEEFACTGQGDPSGVVRWTGITATVAALGVLALLWLRPIRAFYKPGNGAAQDEALPAFAGPLTLLSMVAVVWTSSALFVLPACAPAYHVMPGG